MCIGPIGKRPLLIDGSGKHSGRVGLEGEDLRSANHHKIPGPRRELAIERLPCVPTERHLGESQGDNGRHQQEQNVAGFINPER